MKPEYFPVLNSLDLSETNIVSIPESVSRFAHLAVLQIRNCKQLREIPRLPQSVRDVDVRNCYSLNAQSSSRLLNQIVEISGISPNRARKGTRSRILMDSQTSKHEDDYFGIQLPGTEIPKWLNLNHESDGNVISFWVGPTSPNIFYVCFAFGPVKYPWPSWCYVDLSINGRKIKNIRSAYLYELSDNLWIFSLSNNELQNQLNRSNPSELNYVDVTCEMEDWVKNHPRRWGFGVECICQWASNNGGCSRHQCRLRRRNHRPPPYARRPQKHYLSHFGWLRIRFRLWKRSSRPTRILTATLMSRALREMEEIDPRAFNNGAEDSGLSIAPHSNQTYGGQSINICTQEKDIVATNKT